ncbi:MAG: NAD(P)-dependent alcohol dehydrogenase, partial [Actinobacteria bacterium]|nr:NAD(P)-dependent alcohol dehydrogenase [Actinomycetota bacterium]
GPLLQKRRSLSGSQIGGVPELQEMLDFCGSHNIVSDIELIKADYINEAYERTIASDVKYRFVIDAATF